MNPEIEAAQAAVQAARAQVVELENVQRYVTDALPKAQQALEAAVAKLRRLTQADGSADQLCRQHEIDRLNAAIKEARNHA
ncbi:hypothetical protein PPTS312_28730 [Pseudomonas putida]|uniref:Uncharacterized protein n=1 Tax=Pseudomonas putida TaxID=303 RepID=A0A7U6RCW3_PSEPU|nr:MULTISPECIES: hypothetical protein [Pseudomonas]MDD2124162.1 hypothetical protein [Pseudomonas monteilii]BBU44958.1 hypothetical protein PPTS312_28730 [Pseudomonas putida]